jgi:polysaccharide export outer membrane protein
MLQVPETLFLSRPGLISPVAACIFTAACSVNSPLPAGSAAYAIIPYETAALYPESYQLRSGDIIAVSVLLEPELSVESSQIDPAGNIDLPLVGAVRAEGQSPEQFSRMIESVLTRYIRKPKVAVTVTPAQRTVAIEGAVNRPGVYPIVGRSTLIEALALGGSPSQYANNDQIFVLRNVDGRQAGARFDIARIRAGIDPDPVILPGDRVVVSASVLKEAVRDYLSAPIFNVFRLF